MAINDLLGKIAQYILNPVIVLGFTVATIVLFYGIVQMIWKADSAGDLKTNRKSVMYGVVGLFIMFSVYGILRVVLATFGIPCTLFFCS
jgi:hypothetical protein